MFKITTETPGIRAMIVGYCQANAFEPASSLENQKRKLLEIGAQEIFSEKVGIGGTTPQLDRAIQTAQKGDTIAVTRPYRIARSTRGVFALIERLGTKGVGLRILGTPVDTGTTTGRMILGSAPAWSLGISPVRAALMDLITGGGHNRARKTPL